MPYAVVRLSDESIVKEYSSMPKSFEIEQRRIISPVIVGDETTIDGETYRLVEIVRENFQQPNPCCTHGGDTQALVGNTLTITRRWVPWTPEEIAAATAARDAAEIDDLMRQRLTMAVYMLLNEIRVLKNQNTMDLPAFRTWLSSPELRWLSEG